MKDASGIVNKWEFLKESWHQQRKPRNYLPNRCCSKISLLKNIKKINWSFYKICKNLGLIFATYRKFWYFVISLADSVLCFLSKNYNRKHMQTNINFYSVQNRISIFFSSLFSHALIFSLHIPRPLLRLLAFAWL